MRTSSNSLTSKAVQRFSKNTTGMLSFLYILLCGCIAVSCYLISPDNSQNANQMHLEIHSKKPGFTAQILEIPSQKKTSFFTKLIYGDQFPATEILIDSYRISGKHLIVKKRKEFDIEHNFPLSIFEEPIESYIQSKTYYFGTDKFGRDLLSRILIGTRISFSIGFIAVLISLIIGTSIGAIAGYYGGKIDTLCMWLINVTWSIPTLLLVIAITLALGKGVWQVFISVGLTMWVEVARVVRGQVLSVKTNQYVEAAKALGFSDFRIVFKHILPNIAAPIIVISAANFAASILIESGLSFLGIGAQPPIPSWGGIVKDHYSYLLLGKPYLAILPGMAISTLVMAFVFTGNALRDSLDVKDL
jgi:peptide/nickel transport system permease protein